MKNRNEDFVIMTGEEVINGIAVYSFKSLTKENVFYKMKDIAKFSSLKREYFTPHNNKVLIIDIDDKDGYCQNLYFGYQDIDDYQEDKKDKLYHSSILTSKDKIIFYIVLPLSIVILLIFFIVFLVGFISDN